ncbi:probable E3 SUMO-protein ligase RNF212 [Elephas maximus indicus]|uniref:probable E3 SUMO-protein ligase RNF212 n=1 Tax=Elephas maximus indicus TaxID=99487 RepID=UPI0021164118|nr:probable E3 SUMO-protein ligase RNF212 [Elephas maximus indicus]
MTSRVFCNRCFQPPHRTSRFSLTNCGHVYCDLCLHKGKKDECLICKVPCHTILLSKHTDSNIQAFFMGIDGLCTKYSKEASQISEFQEKHRKRLLAFYREKIAQLEESLRRAVLQIEQLQSMRSSQQSTFNPVRNPVSTKRNGHLLLPSSSSTLERMESMEVDVTPSPMRRPEVAAGPMRMSLISPPQDGRMGSVSHRGPQHPGLTPSQASVSKTLRIPPLQIPYKGPSQTPPPQLQGRAARRDTPSLRGPQAVSSFQPQARRPPISIAGLLQRQHSGVGLREPTQVDLGMCLWTSQPRPRPSQLHLGGRTASMNQSHGDDTKLRLQSALRGERPGRASPDRGPKEARRWGQEALAGVDHQQDTQRGRCGNLTGHAGPSFLTLHTLATLTACTLLDGSRDPAVLLQSGYHLPPSLAKATLSQPSQAVRAGPAGECGLMGMSSDSLPQGEGIPGLPSLDYVHIYRIYQ